MKQALVAGSAFAALLMLANCATAPGETASTDHYVSASSTASLPAGTAHSYALIPVDADIAADDADFVEYAAYVARALSEKGLAKAADGTAPDMIIRMRYGTGEPTRQVRADKRVDIDRMSMGVPGNPSTSIASSSGKGSAKLGNSSRAGPTTRFAVSSDIAPKAYTTYTHFILLDAYLVDPAKDASQWDKAFETDIGSTGTDEDLHQVFPYMIAATLDTIATTTDDVVRTTITPNDTRLELVRSGG